MTCANTSLPTYIIGSRGGSHRRVANSAFTVQVGDTQNHEKGLFVPWLTSRSLENVGTLLWRYELLQIPHAGIDTVCGVAVSCRYDQASTERPIVEWLDGDVCALHGATERSALLKLYFRKNEIRSGRRARDGLIKSLDDVVLGPDPPSLATSVFESWFSER